MAQGDLARGRQWRRRLAGAGLPNLCRTRFGSFTDCSARRYWRPRFWRRRSRKHQAQENCCAAAVAREVRFPMQSVLEVIGVSRSNLIERLQKRPTHADRSAALPDDEIRSLRPWAAGSIELQPAFRRPFCEPVRRPADWAGSAARRASIATTLTGAGSCRLFSA